MQARERRGVGQRLQLGAFADQEFNLAAERQRHNQNIGKQNRRVEAEPSHRLQRYLGGQFRIETKIEKTASLLAHRTVFRKISPGLAHHPNRWSLFALPVEHTKQRLYPHAGSVQGFFLLRILESLFSFY